MSNETCAACGDKITALRTVVETVEDYSLQQEPFRTTERITKTYLPCEHSTQSVTSQ